MLSPQQQRQGPRFKVSSEVLSPETSETQTNKHRLKLIPVLLPNIGLGRLS